MTTLWSRSTREWWKAVSGPFRIPNQQFEDGSAVLGRIDVCRTKVRHEQLMAAEDVQWQEAVAVVVSVEKTLGLRAVDRIVGGIEIENDLFGSRGV